MSFDPNAAAAADSGVFGLSDRPEAARVVLIPVPFDATTSYRRGTANGPAAILEASRQVDLFDLDTGRPYEAGIAMLDEDLWVRELNDRARAFADPVIEAAGVIAGDAALLQTLAQTNACSQELNQWVSKTASEWLAQGKLVGTVGGDHSTPLGLIGAVAQKIGPIGVLHFDAHADLRDAFEGFTYSHASIMRNVVREVPGVSKLVQVGIRDFCEEEYDFIRSSEGRIETFFDTNLKRELFRGEPWRVLCHRIVSALPQRVFISFDIDALEPWLCPNTGTPVPGGLTFEQAIAVVEELVRSGRTIVGFDVNEVSPGADGDQWDGNVGARVLYKLIGWALLSQG